MKVSFPAHVFLCKVKLEYLGVLYASEETVRCEINQNIGAAGAVLRSPYRTVVTKEGAELEGKALHVLLDLCPCSHLRSHPSHPTMDEILNT